MSWQDAVFTIGTLIFSISLIPSIRSTSKPHLYTSLVTGTVLVAFGVTYTTLGLVFSAGTALINSVLWYILAWQKYTQK